MLHLFFKNIFAIGTISQHVQDKLQTLRDRCENMDDDSDDVNVEGRQNSDDSSPKIVYSKEKLDLFRSIRDDTTSINEICLSCATKVDGLSEHPLFQGSICEPCKVSSEITFEKYSQTNITQFR